MLRRLFSLVAPGLAVGSLTGALSWLPVILAQAVRPRVDAKEFVYDMALELVFTLIAGTVGAIIGAVVVPAASHIFRYPVTRAGFPRFVSLGVIGAWIANVIVVSLYGDYAWVPYVTMGANVGLLIAFAFKQPSQYRNLAEMVLAVSTASVILWNCYATHEDYVDPQGGRSAYCDKSEFAPIYNTSGLVVTGHHTSCDFGGAFGVATFHGYMYLHPINEKEDRKYLIFRYASNHGVYFPRITWKNERNLAIQATGIDADRMLSSLGPVTIDYRVEK